MRNLPHEKPPVSERLLALLPQDGKRMVYGELMRRARSELYLNAGNAGAELALLCSQRLAVSETVEGWQYVRKLPAHADVVPLRRPVSAIPRPAFRRAAGAR